MQAWRVELGEGYEVYLLPPSSESEIEALKTRLLVKKAPTPQQPHTLAVPSPQQPHVDAAPVLHVSMLTTLAQQHSHWELGALAELIHNADGADASELEIDVLDDSASPGPFVEDFKGTLLFADNGKGMNREEMVFMMNLGHDLVVQTDRARANRFGMGFKTGSMANAAEALVLSKVKQGNMIFGTVGILSRTYCVASACIAIPILSYDLNTCKVVGDNKARFFHVLEKYTPFTEGLLVKHFSEIKETGTRVYLMKLKAGALDLMADKADIRMVKDSSGRGEFMQDLPSRKEARDVPMDYSLRAYCEIMFRRPRMQIKLRGSSVKQRDFLSDPSFQDVEVQIGCTPDGQLRCDCKQMRIGIDEKEQRNGNCGLHIYWHNVLIVSFHKASFMLGANAGAAHGITGIVELNHANPTNNKQSFEVPRSDRQNMFVPYEAAAERWHLSPATPAQNEKAGWLQCKDCKKLRRPLRSASVESYQGRAWTCSQYFAIGDTHGDQVEKEYNLCSEPQEEVANWAQCDTCRKWRRTLKGATPESLLGKNWYCSFGFMVSEKSGREAKLCSEPEERWRDDHDVETCTDKTHYGVSLSTPLVPPAHICLTRT